MSVIRKQFGLVAMIVSATFARSLPAQPLPDTMPLTVEGDLAAQMVAGIDKYLMRELAQAPERRKAAWKWDITAQTSLPATENPYRTRLRTILGVVDERVPNVEVEYVATTDQPSLIAETSKYEVHAVRWPVLPGVDAEGLLLEPKRGKARGPCRRAAGRRLDAGDVCRTNAWRAEQQAVSAAVGGERLPRACAHAHRPSRHLVRQSADREGDEPAASRVHLSHVV